MPDHQWDATRLRFEKPDGGWGEFVELQGPRGPRGVAGGGAGGASVATGAALAGLMLSNGFSLEATVLQAQQMLIAIWRSLGTGGPTVELDGLAVALDGLLEGFVA